MAKLTAQEKKLLKKLLDKGKDRKQDGLKWWTDKGFKVTQTGIKWKSESGKEYNAIKGISKDGKELLLKETRNGAIFTSKEW